MRVAPKPAVLAVTMEAEGFRLVSDRIAVREDGNWQRGKFLEKGANGVLNCGGNTERSAHFKEGRDRTYTAGHVKQKLMEMAKNAI